MNPDILEAIKRDCESIEKNGWGVVTIKIKNGEIYLIESTLSHLIEKPLDNCVKREYILK